MSVINTNIKSLVARDAMTTNNRALSTAMERLSTGKRINSAADDAAGLSISTRMDSQVRGLQMAVKNANDAISVTQTAEGAMQEINDILQRMRELAVQSASDSNSDDDRTFLQAEVSQLSDEIDRIANTTQFNGINVLDGGFANKTFQIGANSGQSMQVSVGDMRSTALGVASSEIQMSGVTPVTSSSTAATEQVVVKATGQAATATQARMLFSGTASGTAKISLTDDVSGLSASVSATLDINDEFSKAEFAKELNTALRQAGQQTVLAGATASAGTVDISDPANRDALKFSVQIGDGSSVENIDLYQRLTSNGVTSTATSAQIETALQAELRSVFSDESESITATFTGSVATVTDAEGRSITISQGAGDGFLFGTDLDNEGALSVDANIQTDMTAVWEGNELVVSSAAGAKVTFDALSLTAGRTITFDAAAGQANQADPQVFTSAAISTISATDGNTARFKGATESSQMALSFSNTSGSAGTTTAQYSFNITNGAGDVYATVSNLDVHNSKTAASVIAAVETALSTGLASLADTSIDASEFDVAFNGNTLTITNNSGRALAVESFSSDIGSMKVTPLNELGAQETLASKNALFSETRISMNTQFFGTTAGTAAGHFKLIIDGNVINGTAGLDVAINGTANDTGTAFAAAIAAQIAAATASTMTVNGEVVTATVDLTTLGVAYDADTNELVITDSRGRGVGFGLDTENNALAGSGMIFNQDFVQGRANNSNVVNVTSGVSQGDVMEATQVKMTLSADQGTFNFSVNGVSLSSTEYDATKDFATSDLKANLDDMMTALNASHPDDVFQYAVSGKDITILQRDGGDVEVSNFATSGAGDDELTMTISGAPGQGDTVVAREYDINLDAASAQGARATKTEATISLSADDAYSMTITNGENDFTLTRTVVDLSDTNSVQAFTSAMESALEGSGISASMDTNGKIYLSRKDGGEIGMKSFVSASGAQATWSPKAGQGDSTTLAGTGSLTEMVAGTVASSSSAATVSVGGGTVAVAQLSVSSQESASAAIDVVDKALTYVNSERSKLGAIENRLTHTIDNLTNVVTNTQAARSRIVDADYAAETSELARTQIIQQAATAMLAQANQSSQSVLSLLQ